LSSETQRQPTYLAQGLEQRQHDQLFDIRVNMYRLKYDVSDIALMIFILMVFLVINLFLTVYCAVSVYQIKHSPGMNRAVQMEANQ
jgi:hypothetical protein